MLKGKRFSFTLIDKEMPASYIILPSQRYIRVTLSGNTSFGDIVPLLDAYTSDGTYEPSVNILFDVRTISQYFSYAETLTLFEYDTTHLFAKIKGKIAILITQRVQFGITRIASTIFGIKGIDVNAFYMESEALQWFGISPDLPSGNSIPK